jgi:hypothetical protein
MLVGNAGAGKSTLAGRFPAPFFLSLDKNLRGPATVLEADGKGDIFYEDNFDKDDNGKEILEGNRYTRFAQVLTEACLMEDVKTIVIDNTTILSDFIIAHILQQQNRKAMEIKDWGTYGSCWKQLVAKLRNCGKIVVIITHERFEKDDTDGQMKFLLAVPGQTADILPTLVTDVWRCEVEEKLVGQTRQHIRQVRVVQSQKFPHLKTSTPSLPTTFPATQEMVNKVLADIIK